MRQVLGTGKHNYAIGDVKYQVNGKFNEKNEVTFMENYTDNKTHQSVTMYYKGQLSKTKSRIEG